MLTNRPGSSNHSWSHANFLHSSFTNLASWLVGLMSKVFLNCFCNCITWLLFIWGNHCRMNNVKMLVLVREELKIEGRYISMMWMYLMLSFFVLCLMEMIPRWRDEAQDWRRIYFYDCIYPLLYALSVWFKPDYIMGFNKKNESVSWRIDYHFKVSKKRGKWQRKKIEITNLPKGGGRGYPPVGKRPIYFCFFLM